jgi:hypothetical protein
MLLEGLRKPACLIGRASIFTAASRLRIAPAAIVDAGGIDSLTGVRHYPHIDDTQFILARGIRIEPRFCYDKHFTVRHKTRSSM